MHDEECIPPDRSRVKTARHGQTDMTGVRPHGSGKLGRSHRRGHLHSDEAELQKLASFRLTDQVNPVEQGVSCVFLNLEWQLYRVTPKWGRCWSLYKDEKHP
jgi:hypothetical protein